MNGERSNSSTTKNSEMPSSVGNGRVRLCLLHASNSGCSNLDCTELHVCKFFLRGSRCKFGKQCKFGHDLGTAHNRRCLARHRLTSSDITAVRKLVRLTEDLPWICAFYNRPGVGCRHDEAGTGCTKLHVCSRYVKGDCTSGKRCKLSHNMLDPQPKALLERHGIDVNRKSAQIVLEFSEALQDDTDASSGDGVRRRNVSRVNEEDRIQASENVSSHKVSEDEESRDDTDDDDDADDYDYTPDICMFNMWKDGCLYKANCHNVHCARPFLWQYKGPQASWINFDDESNKEIEFNFTDPHNESCLSTTGKFPRVLLFKIDFDRMMVHWAQPCHAYKVRRLSTKSSVTVPDPSPQHTRWRWFFKDENGDWLDYEEDDQGFEVDSDVLEKEYLENVGGTFQFRTHHRRHWIDFKKMIETGHCLNEDKMLRRRPAISNHQEGDLLANIPTILLVPSYWDLYVPGYGQLYDKIKINRTGATADEFAEVEKRFQDTMPPSQWFIASIERIQNLKLWSNYWRKRRSIRDQVGAKSNTEMLLFHGGNEEYLRAICSDGLNTVIDTELGKGIPFVRDATRCTRFQNNKMLLLRVLVGAYTFGRRDYAVPPNRPDGSTCQYHSCVDDVRNPSTFVIFEKRQVYPEYIITYVEKSQ